MPAGKPATLVELPKLPRRCTTLNDSEAVTVGREMHLFMAACSNGDLLTARGSNHKMAPWEKADVPADSWRLSKFENCLLVLTKQGTILRRCFERATHEDNQDPERGIGKPHEGGETRAKGPAKKASARPPSGCR